MKEKTINLWSIRADAICITTNGYVNKQGDAVMGAGCALEARAKFPGIAKELGDLLKQQGNHVYRLYTPRYGWYDGESGEQYDTEVFTFPVKHVWNQPADPELIVRSAHELMFLVKNWFPPMDSVVALPRPGCGNGRLKWEDVKPLIEPILDDRIVVVSL